MSKPASFCTICTAGCAFELAGLLLSLSIHHKHEKIYIMCDTKTKEYIDNLTPAPLLTIVWLITLDKYTGLNRGQMENMKIWSDFQMTKALVIKEALATESDTLFLDSDIVITGPINEIDKTKKLGVSPGYIRKERTDAVGYYNGGVLWASDKNIPDDWIEFTKTSRYYDQASIEDLVKKYSYFIFGENYNLQCWRFYVAEEGPQYIANNLSSSPDKNMVYYKKKPLKFIHTHFKDNAYVHFNNLMIDHFKNARMYKILAIIYRIINDKWVLRIPKQPLPGHAHHTNDSYRELIVLLKVRNPDVDIRYDPNTMHCWLEPNLLTNDRDLPAVYCNHETGSASLMLIGNGDIKSERRELIARFPTLPTKPWFYWPRRPMVLEKILKMHGILSYVERETESIFIGNFENSVQAKYRDTQVEWASVLSEYHCTKGSTHKFTNEQYLMKMRSAKYGLCLRGYGSKCHRDVELMAFGTVPLITPECNIDSYTNPLVENIHYLSVRTPDELKAKLAQMTVEDWNTMSHACYEWYRQNVHSGNCWKNMVSNILFDENTK